MKITAVETRRIQPGRHSTLGYLVLVHTEDGITGLGEIAADCHPATVAHCVRQMNVVGRDARNIEAFGLYAGQSTFWRGGPIWSSAVSAVEQALWDIKGKRLGAPVYELMGGTVRDRIKLYTHTRFGDESADDFAASALDAVRLGFAAVKFDPFGLAYQKMDPAEMCHRRMSTRWPRCRQPSTSPWQRASGCTRAGGFAELLEKQAAVYIQPDLCHCGGFGEGRKIAAMAEVYHVRVLPHNPNGPISTVVGVHLGACTPNFEMLEYPRQVDDLVPLLRGVPQAVDGHLGLPTGPGWGVEVDEDVLAQFPAEVD